MSPGVIFLLVIMGQVVWVYLSLLSLVTIYMLDTASLLPPAPKLPAQRLVVRFKCMMLLRVLILSISQDKM